MSWSSWSITGTYEHALPGSDTTETRCKIVCPHCNEQIDYAFASAKTNLSKIGKRHLRTCQGVEASASMPNLEMPPCMRPRAEVAASVEERVVTLETKVSNLKRKMELIADAVNASPPRSSDDEDATIAKFTKAVRYTSEDLARQITAENVNNTSNDNMERTLSCNVCMERPSNVLVKRCGHVSVCNICVQDDFDKRWGANGWFKCYQCNQKSFMRDLMRVHVA